MPQTHIVVQGEHLSSIAQQYGFANWETIWNAPENQPLRAVRSDPHQLLPGDEVLIPDRKPYNFVRSVGGVHTFKVHLGELKLRVRVLSALRDPIANAEGSICVDDGGEKTITTDADGIFEITVERNARQAVVLLGEETFRLAIGHLDPASEPSGMFARLNNLGCWTGDLDSSDLPDEQLRRLGIELFQAQNQLDVDGKLTPELINLLTSAYGS